MNTDTGVSNCERRWGRGTESAEQSSTLELRIDTHDSRCESDGRTPAPGKSEMEAYDGLQQYIDANPLRLLTKSPSSDLRFYDPLEVEGKKSRKVCDEVELILTLHTTKR